MPCPYAVKKQARREGAIFGPKNAGLTDQDFRVPPSNHFVKLRKLKDIIRSASIDSGGLCSSGMAVAARRVNSISTTIATDEGQRC